MGQLGSEEVVEAADDWEFLWARWEVRVRVFEGEEEFGEEEGGDEEERVEEEFHDGSDMRDKSFAHAYMLQHCSTIYRQINLEKYRASSIEIMQAEGE